MQSDNCTSWNGAPELLLCFIQYGYKYNLDTKRSNIEIPDRMWYLWVNENCPSKRLKEHRLSHVLCINFWFVFLIQIPTDLNTNTVESA